MTQFIAHTEKEAWDFIIDNSAKTFKFDFQGFGSLVEPTNTIVRLREKIGGLTDTMPINDEISKLLRFLDEAKEANVTITTF